MIYFSADPHFGRENIFTTSKRPFASLDEMNATILDRYAARVTDDDDLYLLGDLAHRTSTTAEAQPFFDRIPGRKHLIKGNHDGPGVAALPWTSVQDYAELKIDGVHLILFHYPMITWNQARAGSIQLFGHIHEKWAGSARAVNVGVDFWDFAPCTVPEILARAETQEYPPYWDVVEKNMPPSEDLR